MMPPRALLTGAYSGFRSRSTAAIAHDRLRSSLPGLAFYLQNLVQWFCSRKAPFRAVTVNCHTPGPAGTSLPLEPLENGKFDKTCTNYDRM